MATNRHFGWMIGGLALLGSVGVGLLAGEEASAEMDSFYANVASRMPAERAPVVIADSDATPAWTDTPDFANVDAMQPPDGDVHGR